MPFQRFHFDVPKLQSMHSSIPLPRLSPPMDRLVYTEIRAVRRRKRYRCMDRSDLFPTRHIGTQSVPYASNHLIEMGIKTVWFRILSRMILTISKDDFEVTEYTSKYPCIPIECLEFRILYSSYSISTFDPSGMGSDLSSSINNLSRVFLTLVLYRLGKRVLDGRIIRLDEMVLHILHGQRRFP